MAESGVRAERSLTPDHAGRTTSASSGAGNWPAPDRPRQHQQLQRRRRVSSPRSQNSFQVAPHDFSFTPRPFPTVGPAASGAGQVAESAVGIEEQQQQQRRRWRQSEQQHEQQDGEQQHNTGVGVAPAASCWLAPFFAGTGVHGHARGLGHARGQTDVHLDGQTHAHLHGQTYAHGHGMRQETGDRRQEIPREAHSVTARPPAAASPQVQSSWAEGNFTAASSCASLAIGYDRPRYATRAAAPEGSTTAGVADNLPVPPHQRGRRPAGGRRLAEGQEHMKGRGGSAPSPASSVEAETMLQQRQQQQENLLQQSPPHVGGEQNAGAAREQQQQQELEWLPQPPSREHSTDDAAPSASSEHPVADVAQSADVGREDQGGMRPLRRAETRGSEVSEEVVGGRWAGFARPCSTHGPLDLGPGEQAAEQPGSLYSQQQLHQQGQDSQQQQQPLQQQQQHHQPEVQDGGGRNHSQYPHGLVREQATLESGQLSFRLHSPRLHTIDPGGAQNPSRSQESTELARHAVGRDLPLPCLQAAGGLQRHGDLLLAPSQADFLVRSSRHVQESALNGGPESAAQSAAGEELPLHVSVVEGGQKEAHDTLSVESQMVGGVGEMDLWIGLGRMRQHAAGASLEAAGHRGRHNVGMEKNTAAVGSEKGCGGKDGFHLWPDLPQSNSGQQFPGHERRQGPQLQGGGGGPGALLAMAEVRGSEGAGQERTNVPSQKKSDEAISVTSPSRRWRPHRELEEDEAQPRHAPDLNSFLQPFLLGGGKHQGGSLLVQQQQQPPLQQQQQPLQEQVEPGSNERGREAQPPRVLQQDSGNVGQVHQHVHGVQGHHQGMLQAEEVQEYGEHHMQQPNSFCVGKREGGGGARGGEASKLSRKRNSPECSPCRSGDPEGGASRRARRRLPLGPKQGPGGEATGHRVAENPVAAVSGRGPWLTRAHSAAQSSHAVASHGSPAAAAASAAAAGSAAASAEDQTAAAAQHTAASAPLEGIGGGVLPQVLLTPGQGSVGGGPGEREVSAAGSCFPRRPLVEFRGRAALAEGEGEAEGARSVDGYNEARGSMVNNGALCQDVASVAVAADTEPCEEQQSQQQQQQQQQQERQRQQQQRPLQRQRQWMRMDDDGEDAVESAVGHTAEAAGDEDEDGMESVVGRGEGSEEVEEGEGSIGTYEQEQQLQGQGSTCHGGGGSEGEVRRGNSG